MFSRETQDTRAHEWLKQLASADFRGGQWLLADPDAARRTTMAAWDEALDELYDDACVSVGVFNDHRAGKDRMSVLASREQDRSEGRVEEILIMLSGRQVRLFRHGGGLVTKATVRRPWSVASAPQRSFVPEADGLGGVLWRMDQRVLMERAMIIKYLMADLVRLVASGV